jgi:ribonuclease Z
MNARRLALAAMLTLALVVGAAYLFWAPLSVMLARQLATGRLEADALAALPDGLHVGLCGAGSPFPDDRRSVPCTLVVAGKRLFVFDVGSGSARNITKMGFNPGRIEAIFLTHFHSDHIDGLGELMLQRWVSAAHTAPVPVVGTRESSRSLQGSCRPTPRTSTTASRTTAKPPCRPAVSAAWPGRSKSGPLAG